MCRRCPTWRRRVTRSGAVRPQASKVLAGYTCQGLAYPGMPSNTIMSIRVVEAESNEALSAVIYPVFVAGATVWSTPVMDLPGGAAADMEKKLRR